MGAIQIHCIMEEPGDLPSVPPVVGNAVRLLTGNGLCCAVSDGDGADVASLPRENLVRRLLAHQSAIEQVTGNRSVLPVKFGTILASPLEAEDMLAQGRERLLSALAAVRDRVEIEVAATWDLQQALREVSQQPEVLQARESVAQQGQPTIEDKLRLGQVVKACLDRRRDSYRQRMVEHLEPLCLATAPHPLVSDQMVMNVAFLLDRSRQLEFDERVRELDRLFDNEIAFRIVGPLPPYSFSTVEIVHIAPEQIEAARSTLGLGETLSEAEVRRAYRQAAAACQRALDGGEDHAAKVRLAQVRQAQDLLVGCCRCPEPQWSAGKNVFVVNIVGPTGEEVASVRYGKGAPGVWARV
ncbi:MAG: GvpL/GvpF family gas vesicle protein [Chloroflexi bacterium]|nr:GvpL/GvpF family gas vesicle protein [Chloroflexota bacterium]